MNFYRMISWLVCYHACCLTVVGTRIQQFRSDLVKQCVPTTMCSNNNVFQCN